MDSRHQRPLSPRGRWLEPAAGAVNGTARLPGGFNLMEDRLKNPGVFRLAAAAGDKHSGRLLLP